MSVDTGNISDEEDEVPFTFHTNGTNITISQDWCLPLPIAAPYSTVSYEFCTEHGDISFSIVFISLDGDEEVVVEPERVHSDVEPISGSCQLNCPGTLIFMWDNTYSWFNSKSLTYSVDIMQDPVPVDEAPRIQESVKQLSELNQDMSQLRYKLTGIESVLRSVNRAEIAELEKTILSLQHRLQQKKSVLAASIAEKERINNILAEQEVQQRGLCLRLLSNGELAEVLSFVDVRPVRAVCKYWQQLTTCEDPIGRDAPSVDYAPPPEATEGNEHAESLGDAAAAVAAVSSLSDEALRLNGTAGTDQAASSTTSVAMETKILNGEIAREEDASKSHPSYRRDVVQFVRESIDTMKEMEAERIDVKRKISAWKRHFEKRYKRPPSDEEKLRNIPELFQRYSYLSRALREEEQQVRAVAGSIPRIGKDTNKSPKSSPKATAATGSSTVTTKA